MQGISQSILLFLSFTSDLEPASLIRLVKSYANPMHDLFILHSDLHSAALSQTTGKLVSVYSGDGGGLALTLDDSTCHGS